MAFTADFVVDVLCLAVSADSGSANVILEALSRVRAELGCRTCLGVSNISFGLPARPLLNAAFYTMALGQGLSAGIINPLSADMIQSLVQEDPTGHRAAKPCTTTTGPVLSSLWSTTKDVKTVRSLHTTTRQ